MCINLAENNYAYLIKFIYLTTITIREVIKPFNNNWWV